MNRHTFQDAVVAKRSSLANDIDLDGDDDEEVGQLKHEIEGEVDGDATLKFNDAGEVLEPFNMREEREQGHIDENMNFVYKREKGEIDAWLANLDEATMEQGIGEAADARKKRIAQNRERERLQSLRPRLSSREYSETILSLLLPEESVARALKRLSGKDSGWGSKLAGKRENKANSSSQPTEQANGESNKDKLATLIESADELLALGATGVYELTFEEIQNCLASWEYNGREGNERHGPFNSGQIVAWRDQGYFVGATAVYMRRVEGSAAPWVLSDTVEFGDGSLVKLLAQPAATAGAKVSAEKQSKGSKRKAIDMFRGGAGADEDENGDDEEDDFEGGADDEDNSDIEADNNLRDKRSRGKKYTAKDDSDTEEEDD